MTGLAESLLDGATGELPEEAQANLSMIVASGRRLGRLIDDILDYSRLTQHSLSLTKRPVDLRATADVVLTLAGPSAESKELELVNSIPPELPTADADADESRLEQILHNLVGNAVKFTESGRVEIAARAEQDRLLVTVEDTGIGIPQDQLDRIFDAFEQADSGIERAFGGTGLGLTITRQLVELHGGRIWVESIAGEGTSFHFTLPISTEEDVGANAQPVSRLVELEPVAVRPRPRGDRRPASAPTGGSEKILVVDDEPVNLQVLCNHLASEGYAVELATSGPQALSLVERQGFDLVVLDVMMPRMSGYEVCRALRASHSLEELPVIFLSAKNQVSDLVSGLAAGGSDYVAKPVAKNELLARVRTHLELLRLYRNLERLVDQRTAQIRQLIGELEARNVELERFAYTVSHDLQSPLVTIKGFLGMAQRDGAAGNTERFDHDISRIRGAADQMQRLIEELLELSRLGRQVDRPQAASLGELAHEAVELLAAQIAERGAEIEIAPDLPVVLGDPVRLLQVFQNLLSNALKFVADETSPRIEVAVRRAGVDVICTVRDNGIGIDAEDHDKIFGVFDRLNPDAEGTGIGLATVRRIVEAHRGRVWVESEGVGKGSTFCFTLPQRDGEVNQEGTL